MFFDKFGFKQNFNKMMKKNYLKIYYFFLKKVTLFIKKFSLNKMKSLPLRILNVAEKPSIARKITEFLSMNVFNKETSLSKYNPIFSFPYAFKIASENIQESSMKFTSVTGHLTQLNYLNPNSKWKEINAFDLFSGF